MPNRTRILIRMTTLALFVALATGNPLAVGQESKPVVAGQRVFSVGRLDRDSEGLLLFTNDGALANRLTHPRYEVAKVYDVEVSGDVTTAALQRLTSGIRDDGELLRARSAQVVSRDGNAAKVGIAL